MQYAPTNWYFVPTAVLSGMAALTSACPAQAPLYATNSYGVDDGDRLGASVCSVGDLDGDQIPDLAVGAPGTDTGSLVDNGAVYFYSAGDPGQFLGCYTGATAMELAGTTLAALGDVDGDLIPDLAVGAPDYNGNGGVNQGKVVVVSGSDFNEIASFTTDETGALLGRSLVAVEDLTGDGISELLVGAPEADLLTPNGGAAILLQVTPTALLELHRFDGSELGEQLGYAVCTVPDVNGDTIVELAISSPFRGGVGLARGSVQIFSANAIAQYPLLTVIEGEFNYDQLGFALIATEDPDGGGAPHLVATFIGRNSSAGGCGVYDASTGVKSREYLGGLAGNFLGTSAVSVSDLDEDGIDDVILGSSLATLGGVFSGGSVEVLSGAGTGQAGGSLIRLYQTHGSVDSERLGEALALVGDLDQDGRDDYAWSRPGAIDPLTSLVTGTFDVVRSSTPRMTLDQQSYVDLDKVVADTLGYSQRAAFLLIGTDSAPGPKFLISFGSPWLMINGLSTDAEGELTVTGTLPSYGGLSFCLYFQALVVNPGGNDAFLYSDLASAQVN